MRVGAGQNMASAGGSRTENHSSLRERAGAGLRNAEAGLEILSRAGLYFGALE